MPPRSTPKSRKKAGRKLIVQVKPKPVRISFPSPTGRRGRPPLRQPLFGLY